MSLDNFLEFQDQICYVQCGLCTTILLVSVPYNSLSMVVTVRCGHCSSVLSVDMSKATFFPLHSSFPSLNQQEEMPKQDQVVDEKNAKKARYPLLCFSSSDEEEDDDDVLIEVIQKPPERKQRAPSAYNHFIKEEIKRLKIQNPDMTHKQAFSAAAKNWAHCPQSQYKGGDIIEGFNEEVPCFLNGYEETKSLGKRPICSTSTN